MADAGSGKRRHRLHDRAVSAYGRLDAIWANAGVSADWCRSRTDVEHCRKCCASSDRPVSRDQITPWPPMIKQKSGSIVCTASVVGLKAAQQRPSLRSQQGRRDQPGANQGLFAVGPGVRINAVWSRPIETGMTKPIFDNAKGGAAPTTRSASSIRQARRPAA